MVVAVVAALRLVRPALVAAPVWLHAQPAQLLALELLAAARVAASVAPARHVADRVAPVREVFAQQAAAEHEPELAVLVGPHLCLVAAHLSP